MTHAFMHSQDPGDHSPAVLVTDVVLAIATKVKRHHHYLPRHRRRSFTPGAAVLTHHRRYPSKHDRRNIAVCTAVVPVVPVRLDGHSPKLRVLI